MVPAVTAAHAVPFRMMDVMAAFAYVQPLVASMGMSTGAPLASLPLTLMSPRLVMSFGGGGTENVQVVAMPTSVRSVVANSSVLVTG